MNCDLGEATEGLENKTLGTETSVDIKAARQAK